ncbi:Glucosamine-6-phosphate deaminase [isomerizing], alternative [Hyphomicrobium sulfonivorans]|uniref:Glucosamine-6-phosphate deaminase [isomerizing], alternative n=1 Tax=Hyphomicrobium sulfonivorans TaxID=121290 RepID=A0A109BPL0_HYPSL|nr:SIS domain-containing protein [Hyphomicrobium sulfonivorans]KWT72634.1 Glucosamine-6-phosphate deaminase [isomerizing], alternative [Hyphomicrobium sulfonivorans]
MGDTNVLMAQELSEAPTAVFQQQQALAAPLAELVARLNSRPPQVVVTCARGSSAHAAAFGKHLIERYVGLPVSPAAPSIASIYGGGLKLKDQMVLSVSQSGRSSDLLALTESAKKSGALTVAITNAEVSPLADMCDIVLPICAGPERSVAATKTFIATAAALARLTAQWSGDKYLQSALDRLPERLVEAAALDWSTALPSLAEAPSLVTIGRGSTLGIAREAALKLKETCSRHAEAFSGAEFMHGPVSLVEAEYPIIMFKPTDAAAPGMDELAIKLRRMGAELFVAEPGEKAPGRLPVLPPDQPETDAICLIQSFYAMAVELAQRLEIDVDRPRHLNKVTSTL